MTIKQFNGNWVSQEDRLMFRFNTQDNAEYRFWMTRLVVKALINGSQHLVQKALEKKHEPKTAQAIQEFQQQNLKQQADFKVPYQEAVSLPLGDQPVLVIGLQMKQEGDLMSVDFQLVTKQNLNMKLTLPMLQTMVLLLDKLQAIANWSVGLPEPTDPELPSVTVTGIPDDNQGNSGPLVH